MFDSVESEVQEFVGGLAGSLGVKSYTIELKRGISTPGKGLLLQMRPDSAKCSHLNMVVQNGVGEISLFFGTAGWIEVGLPDSGYSGIATLQKLLKGLCEAVMLGRITEKVWHRGSKLVRCESRVFFDGTWHQFNWGGFLLYRFCKNKDVTYESWDEVHVPPA